MQRRAAVLVRVGRARLKDLGERLNTNCAARSTNMQQSPAAAVDALRDGPLYSIAMPQLVVDVKFDVVGPLTAFSTTAATHIA